MATFLQKDTMSYFDIILTIPRPSGKEDLMRKYIVDWSNNFGYEYKVDEVGNIVVYVPATLDQVDKDIIILQAHMDMVCVKGDGVEHNFEKDPIIRRIEGDRMYASGTTLGADNGIGLAMILAATHLESHPPLELLFTVEEETGLRGASSLDASLLSGKKAINLDTEVLGEICISSAGGARVNITKILGSSEISKYPHHTISTHHMKGGHSGTEIHENRGNAIKLLLECVNSACKELNITDCEISHIEGGQAFNAIPGSCSITIGTQNNKEFDLVLQKNFEELIKNYDAPEAGIMIGKENQNPTIYSSELNDFIKKLINQPSGVLKMSDKIEGLVETSINLGMISTIGGTVEVTYLPRSSNSTSLDKELQKLQALFSGEGENTDIQSKYYGREQDPNDELVQLTKQIYTQVTGEEPETISIHAGLECGGIAAKLGEGAQVVSFGPTITDPHSPQERVNIPSVKITEQILFELLKDGK